MRAKDGQEIIAKMKDGRELPCAYEVDFPSGHVVYNGEYLDSRDIYMLIPVAK